MTKTELDYAVRFVEKVSIVKPRTSDRGSDFLTGLYFKKIIDGVSELLIKLPEHFDRGKVSIFEL